MGEALTKLAIIDLDGVVANSAARFERATKPDGRIDWKIAFTPDLVDLDVLIEGADQAVRRLEQHGHTIIFLTSRPETMQEATIAWLARHGLDGYELVMKPMNKQFTKTVVWKADEVLRMASNLIVDSVLFIDDEASNRTSVEELGLNIVCKMSLDDYIPDDNPIVL